MTADAQARYAARRIAEDPEGWYAYRRALIRKHAEKNRPQHAAHNKVYRAIKSGRLVRPDRCENCQKQCKPEAAHTDYSKPLDVKWLCRKCHAVMDMGD